MSLCDWRFTNRRLHPTKGPSVHTETKVKVGGGFETTTVDLDFFLRSCVRDVGGDGRMWEPRPLATIRDSSVMDGFVDGARRSMDGERSMDGWRTSA